MSLLIRRTQQAIMSIFFFSSALILTVGGALWWLFRRPFPFLTTEDLPPTENVKVVRKLSDDERNVVKTAFLSSPDFQWMLCGANYKTTNLDKEQLWELTSYMMECALRFCEQYGHIIVCQDDDGTFLGCVALLPPYKNQTLYTLHFLSSILPLGKPVPKKMGIDVSARFDAFTMQCDKEQKEYMKGIPHWSVGAAAVSPQAQGKGVGRKLLQTVIAIAGNTPIYLECDDGTVAFYEKMGFSVKKQFDLVPKGIEDTTSFIENVMVYGL